MWHACTRIVTYKCATKGMMYRRMQSTVGWGPDGVVNDRYQLQPMHTV
jgi:hypothetical protein